MKLTNVLSDLPTGNGFMDFMDLVKSYSISKNISEFEDDISPQWY